MFLPYGLVGYAGQIAPDKTIIISTYDRLVTLITQQNNHTTKNVYIMVIEFSRK